MRWDSLTLLNLGKLYNTQPITISVIKGANTHQNAHAQFRIGVTLYEKYNEEGNNVGSSGLLHLSKGTWEKLKELLLSSLWLVRGRLRVGEGY